MNSKQGKFILSVFITLVFCGCNNFFHDLIPPDGNFITRFEIDGQIGAAQIGNDTINVFVEKGTDLQAVIPRISVSAKASLLPVTMDYVQAAFPGTDLLKAAKGIYETDDLTSYVSDLIRENPDFNVPALTLPMDFTGPITFIVVSGQGTIRQYTVNVVVDSGEPRLMGFGFAKYDNPELMGDARCMINEAELTVYALAVYPAEMDYLSYAIIPSFEILGDSLEIDGLPVQAEADSVQFNRVMGLQTKTITVWRDGASKDYALMVVFDEDPDTIRSITDFRFYKTDNPSIAVNAVASIINNGSTGTITVQVYYSGAKPSVLVPSFITPGTASVGDIQQTSRANSHDFSSPVEYRVVSRNGQYKRVYTVKVEFINLTSATPRITSFRFSQNHNHDLVQDTVASISDGLIMIDAYYGSTYVPDTLIPEFTAEGIVRVLGSVQISGMSAQNFSFQIKYTVTNPENPMLTRDYWVQTRMTRDTSSVAQITSFGFYPEDNPGLNDIVIGKVDQTTGKISVFAPVGSGVTARTMYPQFEAVGQVSVGGIVQSSGSSPHVFEAPIIYKVVSANGKNSRNYTVEVKELRSTIYVDCNAWGDNDGTSWKDAFISLRAACEAAAQFPEDVPKEIWIARGTYRPSTNIEDYFKLTPNTSYIGGFAGNETAKGQRNVAANKVTISGDLGGGRYSNNLFGSFNGTTMLTVNGDLNFEDLTLENAKALGDSDNGGAICAVLSGTGNLNISRCNFKGLSASGSGGAVYVNGGNVEITDSTIEDVQAANGGAIYADSTNALTIRGVSITNARASSNSGGIYQSGGTLTVDKLTLRNITGRGIYKNSSSGVSLSGIDASGISGDAVFISVLFGLSSGSFTLGGNSKFNNTGTVSVSTSVSVQVTDTEIRNNSGNSALYVGSGSGRTTIARVTIDGVPNGEGISAFPNGKILFADSIIKNCRNNGGYISSAGGGISIGGGDVEISNVTIKDCSTHGKLGAGGGINLCNTGNAIISGVTIEDVEANDRGGAIHAHYGVTRLTISNTNIRRTKAGIGGAIYSWAKNVNISDTAIEDIDSRDAEGIGGGGLYISGLYTNDIPNVSISNTIIRRAIASGPGGGITFVHANANISDTVIEDCTGSLGGGIHLIQNSSLTISDSRLERCTATTSSGAIYRDSSSTLNVINTPFISCSP